MTRVIVVLARSGGLSLSYLKWKNLIVRTSWSLSCCSTSLHSDVKFVRKIATCWRHDVRNLHTFDNRRGIQHWLLRRGCSRINGFEGWWKVFHQICIRSVILHIQEYVPRRPVVLSDIFFWCRGLRYKSLCGRSRRFSSFFDTWVLLLARRCSIHPLRKESTHQASSSSTAWHFSRRCLDVHHLSSLRCSHTVVQLLCWWSLLN